MKPLEAVLVYQHFFVLQSLMESIKRVHNYVQEQFEEEFRYVQEQFEESSGMFRSSLKRVQVCSEAV
jgi:hypothetical protein